MTLTLWETEADMQAALPHFEALRIATRAATQTEQPPVTATAYEVTVAVQAHDHRAQR